MNVFCLSNWSKSTEKITSARKSKRMIFPVSGEIVWVKSVDNRLEAGLKIKDMDNELKSEILNWIFPQWLEKKRDEKTDKAVAIKVSESKKI